MRARGDGPTQKCRHCGSSFRSKSRNPSAYFCSMSCSHRGRKRPNQFGERNPGWKGHRASIGSARERARTRYPAQCCKLCGAQNAERHHQDGDPYNNEASNLAILCRRCHMIVDGRLESLKAMALAQAGMERTQPQPCVRCRRMYKPRRNGLCSRCYDKDRRQLREPSLAC